MMGTKSYMEGNMDDSDADTDDEEIEDNSSEIVGVEDEEYEAPKKPAKSLFKKPAPSTKPKTGAKSLLKKTK